MNPSGSGGSTAPRRGNSLTEYAAGITGDGEQRIRAQTLVKAVLVWAAILVVAIVNGALRDAVLVHSFGPTVARALSGVILCLCVVAAAAVASPWLGPLKRSSWWLIGAVWLALTVVFELTVAYVQHTSWQEVVGAYTLQGGNIWPLVLVTTFVAPWLGARIRGLR